MRIVGGKWRGMSVEAPSGRGITRPTTDRVREAIASMVLSARGLDLSGSDVLDAFAGSGALGFELLSRGARSCTFVDKDGKTAARIKRSAAALPGCAELSRAIRADIVKNPGVVAGSVFDVVLLDPPYAMTAAEVAALVEALVAQGSLVHGSLVLYERASDAQPLPLEGSEQLSSKRYGNTSVELYAIGEHDA